MKKIFLLMVLFTGVVFGQDLKLNNNAVTISNGILVDEAILSTSHTLDADSCKGYVFYVTGARTITLPAAVDGMSMSFFTIGANAISIDCNGGDLFMLDGTALSDGDKITNTSTSGDAAVITYYNETGWYAHTNGWSDGN